MSEVAPTRSAYLALREEREGMQEGYRFLDEKRLVLAAEIMLELAHYKVAQSEFQAAFDEAVQALQGAVGRHGLQGLYYYPPAAGVLDKLDFAPRSVLGVEVCRLDRITTTKQTTDPPAVNPSPEAEECRRLFAQLMQPAAKLATMEGNLERLRAEYQRTSRRARALEDILLPEIDRDLSFIDNVLEELDKEEAIRVRYSRPNP